MKHLFEHTELNHLKLKNRLFRSATWDGLVNENGILTDEVYKIYEELAKGGIGTIITGLMDVSAYSQALPGNMRLYSDELIESYKHLTDLVHQYDCNIIPQINMNHYIMKDKISGQFIRKDIDELTQIDIDNIVELYVEAAIRAVKAGFDGIQIHGAFNWLLNRSFNPLFNHRTDAFGGTIENRSRLYVEVLHAIRTHLPDTHITTKIGFYSDLYDKQAIEQYVSTCRELSKNGIDSIEISANQHLLGKTSASTVAGFLPLALEVKKHIEIPIILVGRHRHLESMEHILNETSVEYFSMSRSLIREPDLPNRWKSGDYQPALCISCDSCFSTYGKHCVFRDN